ncbi:MAG TPA: hypothetical protein VMR34_05335 [Candidatus Saccharimonadales bacterium]|nr:hypothetical protein [Candidatus Saccharimonadales bacterium]
MHILETINELDERPRAAFLVPSEFTAINLYHFSEYYRESRQELLDEGRGVVLQQSKHEHGSQQRLFVDTLIFDSTESGEYLWQLSRGSQGERTIWQVIIAKDRIEGASFKTDRQGRLVESVYIEDELSLKQLWGLLVDIITSEEAISYENKLREDKRLARDKLLEFIWTRMMSTEYPASVNGEQETAYRNLEVFNEKYNKQYEKLSGVVRRIGFTTLRPFHSPLKHRVSIDSEKRIELSCNPPTLLGFLKSNCLCL